MGVLAHLRQRRKSPPAATDADRERLDALLVSFHLDATRYAHELLDYRAGRRLSVPDARLHGLDLAGVRIATRLVDHITGED